MQSKVLFCCALIALVSPLTDAGGEQGQNIASATNQIAAQMATGMTSGVLSGLGNGMKVGQQMFPGMMGPQSGYGPDQMMQQASGPFGQMQGQFGGFGQMPGQDYMNPFGRQQQGYGRPQMNNFGMQNPFSGMMPFGNQMGYDPRQMGFPQQMPPQGVIIDQQRRQLIQSAMQEVLQQLNGTNENQMMTTQSMQRLSELLMGVLSSNQQGALPWGGSQGNPSMQGGFGQNPSMQGGFGQMPTDIGRSPAAHMNQQPQAPPQQQPEQHLAGRR